jgi:hypothetical protein
VLGTAQLVNVADTPFVIVDTTGYIEGTGRVLKSYKIEAVRPDLIVAIEKRGELETVLRSHRNYPPWAQPFAPLPYITADSAHSWSMVRRSSIIEDAIVRAPAPLSRNT